VLTAHPGKRLENNYSLNTVDICPVGALTSSDFRFKMRVWFLKETKSICTSCATGCNTVIGSREDIVYRQTPRENDQVNSCWMCDYGRLNFKYLEAENRLLEPYMLTGNKLMSANWKDAIAQAARQLRQFSGWNIAIIASGRMTNEELWLTRKTADLLGVRYIDILPRVGPGDDILLSRIRNPNTIGTRLILGLDEEPGAKLHTIADGLKSGEIRALLVLGENPITCGIAVEHLVNLPAFIAMDILSNAATDHATVVLPAAGFAEKRGSMINGDGRLQRLNRAVRPPGNARDDWEILRDLLQALGGSNGLYSIDDVFRQMSSEISQFSGLTLNKIGDLGVQVTTADKSPPPPVDPKEHDIEEAEKKRPVGR
jgi:NADH-quinone oxidoreductase subunit G